jgi:hypothetical protein
MSFHHSHEAPQCIDAGVIQRASRQSSWHFDSDYSRFGNYIFNSLPVVKASILDFKVAA